MNSPPDLSVGRSQTVSAMAWLLVLTLLGLPATVFCEDVSSVAGISLSTSAIQALPRQTEVASPGLVRLGERLFTDRRLSGDGSISCAGCHQVERGGDDDKRLSTGVSGRPLSVNTPTVLNVSHNYILGWTGKHATLSELADAVFCSPEEMDSDWDSIVSLVQSDPEYAQAFLEEAKAGVTREAILEALVCYMKSLTTPDSPFDRYLLGDRDALSGNEIAGYYLFESYGCIACHQGQNVGANLFQKFGLFGDYFADCGREPTAADLGRFQVTGNEADRHVFRVPSLRNVARTAPYFHDGSGETLEQAVQVMAAYQLGRDISDEDVSLIVAFLRTLSGSAEGEQQ